MSGGNQDYPPQCTDSCVSSTIGQINDLSGPEEQFDSQGEQTIAAQALKLNPTHGGIGERALTDGALPVVITGSRPPFSNHFPGLRESLIASAIIQLAEQIPEDNGEIREAIIQAAERLHRAGGDKILRGKIVRRRRRI